MSPRTFAILMAVFVAALVTAGAMRPETELPLRGPLVAEAAAAPVAGAASRNAGPRADAAVPIRVILPSPYEIRTN